MKTIVHLKNLFLLALFIGAASFDANATAVVAPNGGGTYVAGTNLIVTWSATDLTKATVVELYKGASSIVTIYSGTNAGEDGTLTWPIPLATTPGSDYSVVVTVDAVSDESDTDFTIEEQVINVTVPNTNVSWIRGTNHSITWTDNVPGTVKVELVNNFTTTTTVLTTLEGGNSFSWDIPAGITLGTQYQIVVTSETNPTISDLSDVEFSIIAQTIVVTTPNTAVCWIRGTNHNIEWTNTATENVKIELYDGSTYSDIAVSAPGNSYNWAIPGGQALGTTYQIKVSSVADPSIDDQSDVNFKITDPIALTDPSGGEIWATGQSHNVTWTGGSGTATIRLYSASGSTLYGTIASSVTSPYNWILNGSIPSGSNYRIKITDDCDGSEDVSAADFRITQPVAVTAPNGGQSWATGSSYNITWSEGSGISATLELWNNNTGLKVFDIATGVAGHTFSWLIDGSILIGTNYRVKVIDAGDGSVDMSNSNFSIIQFTHVSVPNTPGISWNLGTTHNITWTDNVPGPVKIDLYYAGVFHSNLTASVPDGTNSFAWAIPTNHMMGNHFSVRVSSVLDYTTVLDYSDFQFRIDAATNTYDIEVIQPSLTNIIWTSGQDYLISWTDNLNSPVKIDLINYTLNDSTPIAASVVGSTYAWHIPETTPNGSQYAILITSTTENGVQGLSSNYFQITNTPGGANIIIEQPTVSGLTWMRGSSYLISWTDNVPNNVVDIKLCNAGGVDIATIKTGASGSTWVWTIPENTYPVGNYKIKVVYNGASGTSTAPFAIADSPYSAYIDLLQPDVSGITWLRGLTYLISWDDNIPGPVDIFYERTSVTTEVPIATNIVGSTYAWLVPAITEASDYWITIRSHADASIVGMSEHPFAILDYTPGGTIDVLQPDGGETWTKGSTYWISWNDDISENVKIDLINYAGAPDIIPLYASLSGSTIDWTIQDNGTIPPGILYKMRISSTESNVTNESANYFTIVAPAAPTVIYPNPANQFVTITMEDVVSDNYHLIVTDRFNMQVIKRTINVGGDSNEFKISTAELANGVYFFTITSDNTINTKKVIVQH